MEARASRCDESLTGLDMSKLVCCRGCKKEKMRSSNGLYGEHERDFVAIAYVICSTDYLSYECIVFE